MVLLNPSDYQNFKFTRINVPITLSTCPPDNEDSSYNLNVNCDHLCQENCYIGTQKVKRIDIQRVQKADTLQEIVPPRWNVEILLDEVKKENEVLCLLDELCRIFSLACGKYHNIFQYSGLSGFTYQATDVRRSYALEDGFFGDFDFNFHCGHVESRRLTILPENVLILPHTDCSESPFAQQLHNAFLTAMNCRDAISRYILLYYLFEIMYLTPEYQKIKAAFEKTSTQKKHCDSTQKRSELLYQYLNQEFSIQEYQSFGQQFRLTPNILCEIIKTRNDLAHRADTSKISNMMYHHLLPILQSVLNSQNGDFH